MYRRMFVGTAFAVFCTCLVFSPYVFQSFSLSKSVFFSFCGLLALIHWFIGDDRLVCMDVVGIVFGGFVASLWAFSYVGLNPVVSWWGDYERAFGVSAWFVAWVLYLWFRNNMDRVFLYRIVYIVGILLAVSILLQHFGLMFRSRSMVGHGLTGNINYACNVLGLIIPVSLYFVRKHRLWWAVQALLWGAMLATRSEGGLVGAIVGCAFYAGCYIQWNLVRLLTLYFAVLSGFAVGWYVWVKSVRFHLVGQGFRTLWASHGMGSGWAMYRLASAEHTTRELAKRASVTVYDYVHNVYVHMFAAGGVVSGVLWFVLLYYVVKYFLLDKDRKECLPAFAAIVSYIVWSAVGFETFVTLPFVVFLFAASRSRVVFWVPKIVVILVFYIVLYICSYQADRYRADVHYLRAKRYLVKYKKEERSFLNEAELYAYRALQYNKNEYKYYTMMGRIQYERAFEHNDRSYIEKADWYANEALKHIWDWSEFYTLKVGILLYDKRYREAIYLGEKITRFLPYNTNLMKSVYTLRELAKKNKIDKNENKHDNIK